VAEGPGGVEIKLVWHKGHLRERASAEDSSRRHCLFIHVRHSIQVIHRLRLFHPPGSEGKRCCHRTTYQWK
jgi:hypothetical protein